MKKKKKKGFSLNFILGVPIEIIQNKNYKSKYIFINTT